MNPLADFKARTVDAIREADDRQHKTQRALLAQMNELEKQLQGLRDEKQKLEEVAEERERGTAKGAATRRPSARRSTLSRRCWATLRTRWATTAAPAARRAT